MRFSSLGMNEKSWWNKFLFVLHYYCVKYEDASFVFWATLVQRCPDLFWKARKKCTINLDMSGQSAVVQFTQIGLLSVVTNEVFTVIAGSIFDSQKKLDFRFWLDWLKRLRLNWQFRVEFKFAIFINAIFRRKVKALNPLNPFEKIFQLTSQCLKFFLSFFQVIILNFRLKRYYVSG